MCSSDLFSDKEKEKLKEKGWNQEQINFVEDSIVEPKIKEIISYLFK